MMKRTLLLCLASAVLAASSGCGILDAAAYYPFGHGNVGDMTQCAHFQESHSGIASGGCGSCEVATGGSYGAPTACNACGLGPSICVPGPLAILHHIFRSDFHGSGCGETYWGDFYSDPPDCHDPCDNGGQWTGDGHYNSYGVPTVHGGYNQGSPADGGCATCGSISQNSVSHGETVAEMAPALIAPGGHREGKAPNSGTARAARLAQATMPHVPRP